MTDIVSTFVKPAVEELGRFTVVKIKHLFTYLCCFNNNIQSLRNKAQELEDARSGLQRQVDVAENDAQVILPEVTTWLENASTKIQVDKKRINDEIPAVKNGCWGVKSRFRLSRKAVKITGEMEQLMEKRKQITDIATPAPPAAQAEIPLETTYEFQSRKQIEEEIMEALEAKEFTTMGICGMGGVGKTTMAKRIMVRVKNEKDIFQEICLVVISQQVDNLKIQGAIAESLGLKLDKETLEARATKLRARLTGNNRILIVFDDVWDKLQLVDLGIPCGNEHCTILFTSRNKDVLEKMNVQKVYGVEILSDEEAWLLFREKTGSCVDDPNFLSATKEVARECKGLPVALITVGGALKNQTNITVWKDALQQLQSFNPEDMPDVIKEVYNPLNLSYTKLENRRAQTLFLICSLFPEDVNISLEELASYCMGLQIFPNLGFGSEGILEKVRGRVSSIVSILKSRFLLLNGEDEHHVRMHDVVRDVAIYIAKHEAKEGIVDVKLNSMCLSSEYIYQWVSVFSKETSSLLRMHASNWYECFQIKDFSIFKKINKQLNLLSFERLYLKSIPLEIQLLKNLRTLRLKRCSLECFSVVRELRSLEILYCYNCYGIEELPVEIGNLNQLKLLDFTNCHSLRRLPPGVVSNLVELEEFKMLYSFRGWELAATEVQGEGSRNACLNEFANLSKLTCLEIDLEDFNLAAEEISFSPNIVRYHIQIGDIQYLNFERTSHVKGIYVQLPKDINLGSWVLRFLRSADMLYLEGDRLKSLIDKELVNPKTTSIDDLSNFYVYPILEHQLFEFPNLEEKYDGPVLGNSNSFRNLESLQLHVLPVLKHLWKQRPNRNIVSFDKLRQIKISYCENLQNLFSFPTCIWMDGEVDELLCTQKVFFPLLEKLDLHALPKLEVIWNFPVSVSEESNSFRNLRELTLFKNLKSIRLSNLPAMTHLWRSPNLSVSLSNLSEIYIFGCHKLPSLFSCTMPMEFLSQLVKFEIKNCVMMEQVLLNEENENDGNQCRTIMFSKLSELRLNELENLTAFGKEIETIEFPMLEDMTMGDCPKLMSLLSSNENNQIPVDGHDDDTFHLFCSQKISFGNLKKISIQDNDRRNIWCPQIPAGFFTQIEELEISDCSNIRSLFSSSITVNLTNLKKLDIDECKNIEKLIEDDEKMVTESIIFPMLENIRIQNCPMLRSLVPFTGNDQNAVAHHDDHTFHLFCSIMISGSSKKIFSTGEGKYNIWCRQIPTGSFYQLEELEITHYESIKCLFSCSIAENLVNIKKLALGWCNEMVEVIEDDKEMSCEKTRTLFPKLKELECLCLPKLDSFCNWRCDFMLPLLEQVRIYYCPLLKFFTTKSVTTPRLKIIVLGHDKYEVVDLNDAIKRHFESS